MKSFVVLMLWILGLSFVHSSTNEVLKKRTLEGSMVEVYHLLPSQVDSLSKVLNQGIFYGRLRMQTFAYHWDKELMKNTSSIRKNHMIVGLGTSFLYKTAYLHGFGATVGIYASQAYGSIDKEEAYLYKDGKDTFNRYKALNGGNQNIVTIAQAYLEYRYGLSSFKAGRQIFESFLTKSNDSKMIPNTFEGYTVESHDFSKTTIKLAYLTKQKLRDHTSFHHVLARGDSTSSDPYGMYSQNDDAAMHQGLTLSKLQKAKIDDRLFVAEVNSRSIDNLQIWANYTSVSSLISSAMLQLDYTWYYNEMKITPAIRYMQQFDNGAGAIAGANLKTNVLGYTEIDSLDSWLFGVRVNIQKDVWKLRFGYTQIADKGDIIAPWRGFPTAGFTRAMGQYNWYANTKTYLFRLDYDFDKNRMLTGIKGLFRVALQDFDDNKPGVQADSDIYEIGLLKAFKTIPNLSMKLRYVHAIGNTSTLTSSGFKKLDPSYDTVRLDINYLF